MQWLTIQDVLDCHAQFGRLNYHMVKEGMGPNWPKEWDKFGPNEAIFEDKIMTNQQLPRYRCHKEVRALKIQEVNGNTLTFIDPGYPPIEAEQMLFVRYMPVPGDYYVVYDDGYISISPAKAFEEGYTKI